MKAHCSACHADTEVDAAPGDLVECGGCHAKFRIPMPRKRDAQLPRDFWLDRRESKTEALATAGPDFFRLLLGPSLGDEFERLERALIDALGGADVLETIKARAVDKFGEFIADLERDPGLDLEQLGKAFASLEPPIASLDQPMPAASGGGGDAPSPEVIAEACRAVFREELTDALDAETGDDWPPIRLTGTDVGHAQVAVLAGERWVPVIDDGGPAVSHIVETPEIEVRVTAALDAAERESDDDEGDALPTG